VRALTRRSAAEQKTATEEAIVFGYLRLEPKSKELLKNGIPVKLNAKEFSLMEFFMRHPNEVFSAMNCLIASGPRLRNFDRHYPCIHDQNERENRYRQRKQRS